MNTLQDACVGGCGSSPCEWIPCGLPLLLFACVSSGPVAGQSTFGEINGTVTDASGGVIVGATLTLPSTATNQTRVAVTNNTGGYDFPTLQPVLYGLKVENPGFQTELRSGLELQVQQVARIDFKLTVGATTQTVEVTGGAPLLGDLSGELKSVSENTAQMRATSQAYYVADAWKLRPNLTLDLGLRYEFVPPWSYKNDSESNWSIPCIAYTPAVAAAGCSSPTLVRIGTGDFYQGISIARFNPAIPVARDGRLGPDLVKSDYANFAPRVGLAYTMKTFTFHAGAGIFYAQDAGQAVYDEMRNLAGRITPPFNTTIPNVTWQNPYLLNGSNACNAPAPRSVSQRPGRWRSSMTARRRTWSSGRPACNTR